MRHEWPVYVVSLRRCEDRRRRTEAVLVSLGIPFEFVEAIDGESLSPAERAAVGQARADRRRFKRPLSGPEVGCHLSHQLIWRRIVEGPLPGAVVLEDDFEAEPVLPELIAAVGRLSLDNCMVKLYAEKPVAGETLAALPAGHRLVAPRRVPAQTLGYAVDREAAARLLATARPIVRPVDIDIKHWWKSGVAVLVVAPSPLRRREASAKSAIEVSRRATKPAGALGLVERFGRNFVYQIGYCVGAFRARHKWHETLQRLEGQIRLRERSDAL